ncbi:MAG: peptidylprolyl isomerase [Elusimicrobia bacterium]|nr:peptidylprolyl isomerase [Elusimicrobiota bacterium]
MSKTRQWVFLFSAAVLASCGRSGVFSGGDDDAVLFKLGPVYLTKSEMESRILEMGPEYVPYLRTAQGKKALIGAILKQKILVRVALDRGLGGHPFVKDEAARLKKEQARALRLFRENLLIDQLITQFREKELKVTDEEIAAYYNDHRLIYSVRQILVADKQKAQKLYDELQRKNTRSAADFSRLAMMHSMESQSAKAGGKIPSFFDGELEESFSMAAAGLKAGQVSPPVETKAGCHLIYLESTALAAFNDEYRERARRVLERKKIETMFELWKDKYMVEVRDESLKPYLNL